MLTHFDPHAKSQRLVVKRIDFQGQGWLELRTLQGDVVGEIDNDFLPNAPRWSPDGSRIAFGSNDGFLYLYRVGDTVPKAVFHDESLQVGFPEWSPVGSRLVFSARGRASLSPPNIHLLDLQTGRSTQLTDDDNAVDRFPVWSPSGRRVASKRQHLDEPDRPSRVYVVEAESGECRALALGAIQRFGWSPDSSLVLVKDGEGESTSLRAIRLDDTTVAWTHRAAFIHGGAFSADGDRVLCISPNPPMRSGLGVGTRGEGRGTRRSALDSDRWGRWRPLVVVGGADGGPGQRRWGGVGGTACRGRQSRTGPVRLCGVVG